MYDKKHKMKNITGILSIKKYGTQSAMTDFNEYTMIQPEPIERYTGFTEDEVEKLCIGSRLSFEEVREEFVRAVTAGKHMEIYF